MARTIDTIRKQVARELGYAIARVLGPLRDTDDDRTTARSLRQLAAKLERHADIEDAQRRAAS